MKMNWGSWIVVSFVIFAAGTLAMVYISMTTKVDLVSDDYYEKELQYQNHIELVKSTNALEQKVALEFINDSFVIRFPNVGKNNEYSGTIFFFRPSDKRGDFTRDVNVDSVFTQTFQTNIFSQGLWRAKIYWNVGSLQFYSELQIIIQ